MYCVLHFVPLVSIVMAALHEKNVSLKECIRPQERRKLREIQTPRLHFFLDHVSAVKT